MTNQELKELLSCFESSSLGKMKLSTQEFTIELERPCAAAPGCPGRTCCRGGSYAAAGTGGGNCHRAYGGDVLHRSPLRDQPPFVKVGDRVKKGDTLCLIEARK